jgi:hypothetical protein
MTLKVLKLGLRFCAAELIEQNDKTCHAYQLFGLTVREWTASVV